MREYFSVVINQYIKRAEKLLAQVDNSDVPLEYHLLAKLCRDKLIVSRNELTNILIKPEFLEPALQSVRLRRFRSAVDAINQLEVTGMAALARYHDDDIFLTRLVDQIRKEIKYPSLTPAVTTLSSNYFYIYTDIKLMFVPLNEGNYLLHLPDLYHELAHPLLLDLKDDDEYNTRVKDLRRAGELGWAYALEYLSGEMEHEKRRRGPDEFALYFTLWQMSWRHWIIEFFCDLFAIFTLGPAFAWAHIHLCMRNEYDPFLVPTRGTSSHPADDARMRVMLLGLEKIGFGDAGQKITERWKQYLEITLSKSTGLYKRCFPDELLLKIVDLAYDGMKKTPCRIADPETNDLVHSILNEAWQQFWNNPNGYTQWEDEKVKYLQHRYSMFQKSTL